MKFFCQLAAALFLGVAAKAATPPVAVDFRVALTNGIGWTQGGKINYYGSSSSVKLSDRGVPYLAATNSWVRSPDYPDAIASVALNYSTTTISPTRTLTLFPVIQGNECPDYAYPVPPADTSAWFMATWPADLGVSAFTLRTGGANTSGNWKLYSATVTFAGYLAPPTDITLAPLDGSTLAARWSPPEGTPAKGYRYRLLRETESPPVGTGPLDESFHSLSNATQATKEITGKLDGLLPGWDGIKVMTPKDSAGVVQIGTTDLDGILTTPPLPVAGPLSLFVRAQRVVSNAEGSLMPVWQIDGSVTNTLAMLPLANDFGWYRLDFTALEGTRLAFHSTTNRASPKRANGRVLIDDVRILSDFIGPVTDVVECATGSIPTNAVTFAGLEPAAYVLEVRSESAAGEFSDWAASPRVKLERAESDDYGDDDRYAPLRVSTLPRTDTDEGCWRYTFTPEAATLGSLLALQTFAGDQLDDTVKSSEGGTQYGGFYQWTPKTPATAGFGSYSKQGEERVFGLALENDTRQGVRRVTLEVGYGQWGTHANEPDTLKLEWALSPDRYALVASNGWHELEGGSFTAPLTVNNSQTATFPFTDAIRRLEIPFRQQEKGRRIREDRDHLLLRWTDSSPATGANSALGLYHLKIIVETYGGFAVMGR